MTPLTLALFLAADPARPFLNMPPTAGGRIPRRLSQTGAFADVGALIPSPGLRCYEINVPFWSDGADKLRWISLPSGTKIRLSPSGEWTFPAGTVFVKHFSFGERAVETRLLVRSADGGVYGAAYRWRDDQSDADLVIASQRAEIRSKQANGRFWFFPGPQDCLKCHTPVVNVLGVNTRQLNREGPSGGNQLAAWSAAGMLAESITPQQAAKLPALIPIHDESKPLADRTRSYLDANCGFCHRPGVAAADFDARYETPLDRQLLLDAPARINLGLDRARQVAPNDPWRSMVLVRARMHGQTGMPPLAHERVDDGGTELLRRWITSLPGAPTLAPPSITPKSGDFTKPIAVTLSHADRDAVVRYTMDGSPPAPDSPACRKPLRLTAPKTVRARAFRPGFNSSIVVTETFIIGD